MEDGALPSPERPLKALVERVRTEVGTDDPELVRQILTDRSALERQNARNHFEGRLEYARQMHDHRQAALRGIMEYGLQTLKWLFLLNAGAIAVVMAFDSGGIGKSGVGSIAAYTPVIKAVWPFVAGCIAVAFAGAVGFFNFSYSEVGLPSPEMLHNFLAPTSTSWPIARAQKAGEAPEAFGKRFGWRADAFRTAAICACLISAFFFAYGVFRVLRAVLT
jgi:hypothetical protein